MNKNLKRKIMKREVFSALFNIERRLETIVSLLFFSIISLRIETNSLHIYIWLNRKNNDSK